VEVWAAMHLPQGIDVLIQKGMLSVPKRSWGEGGGIPFGLVCSPGTIELNITIERICQIKVS
jgi:hypothetical protein